MRTVWLRRDRFVVAAWLVVCVLLAHHRSQVWHDSISLWLNAVTHTPTSPRPIINLSRSLDVTGFPDVAGPLLTKATRIASVASTFSSERQRQWWAIALTNEARNLMSQNPHEASLLSGLAVNLANREDARHLYHISMFLLGHCVPGNPAEIGPAAEKGSATSVWRCPEPLPISAQPVAAS